MANGKDIQAFGPEDIRRYQQGLMSAAERHALEKAALNDPFLAEALEGYMDNPVDLTADMNELQQRLQDRVDEKKGTIPLAPTRSNWYYLRIAAILLLITGAGWFFYQYSQSEKPAMPIAANQNEPVGTSDTTTKADQVAPSATTTHTIVSFTDTIKGRTLKTDQNVQYYNYRDNDLSSTSTVQPPPAADSVPDLRSDRKDQFLHNSEKTIAGEQKEAVAPKPATQADSTVVVTAMGVKRSAKAAPYTADKSLKDPISEPLIGWKAYNQYLKDSARAIIENSWKSDRSFVELSFQVDAQGKPNNFNIISSFSKAAAEEAWRLVSQGPLWKPGKGQLKIYF